MNRRIPWLAAILNFLLYGAGYLYLNERRILGMSLLVGYLAIWAMYELFPMSSGRYVFLYGFGFGLGFIIIGIGLAYDAYQLASKGRSSGA